MQKWELYCFWMYVNIQNPSQLYVEKGQDGKTQWEKISALASEGWELVSVTPIAKAAESQGYGGGTAYIIYTFKRPIP